MNVVSMPNAEQSTINVEKSTTSNNSITDEKDTKDSSEFGKLVEAPEQQSNSETTNPEESEDNIETVETERKGAAKHKNKMEEFLFDYQRNSAEQSFSGPNYETPEGFEEFAHPVESYMTVDEIAQFKSPSKNNLLTNVVNQATSASNDSEASTHDSIPLDSYRRLKTIIQNSSPRSMVEEESSEDIATKMVIPIPPTLNFLTHKFEHIEPKEIPEIVTQSSFLKSALNTPDLNQLMNQQFETAPVLASLGFKPNEVNVLVDEIGQVASPNQILDKLGFDAQQIVSELTILKNNLQLEGLAPYMERADELYNPKIAEKVPTLVVEKTNLGKQKFQGNKNTSFIQDEMKLPQQHPSVGNLNELLAKEQIEVKNIEADEPMLYGPDDTNIDEKIDNNELISRIEIDTDQLKDTASFELQSNSDNNDNMLDTQNQTFEISNVDSANERVELVKSIMNRVQSTIKDDLQTMQFNLRTENLGDINLAISSSENALQVSIKTEMEEARNILTTELANIQEALGKLSDEIQSVEVNVEHDESWTQNQEGFFEKRESHQEQQSFSDDNGSSFKTESIETVETISKTDRSTRSSESSTLEVRV